MRAKAIGISICLLQLTLLGCQQKSVDAPQSVSAQNASSSGVPQPSTPSSNAAAQPTATNPETTSPAAAPTPPIATNEEQASASNAALHPAKPDPCALIKSSEIQRVQGEPVRETKASDHVSESFIVSQCFYGTPTFSNSINLEVTWSNQSGGGRRGMREFWNQKFHPDSEREREREEESEREMDKPTRIKGVGDEAFWVRSAVGGALYVLKNDAFFRLSIGGKGTDQAKITKARMLAAGVASRL